ADRRRHARLRRAVAGRRRRSRRPRTRERSGAVHRLIRTARVHIPPHRRSGGLAVLARVALQASLRRAGASGTGQKGAPMRSRQLEQSLTDYLEAAACHLREEVAGGAEVPFEVGASGASGGRGPTLYCYRALTAPFIAERAEALESLPVHAHSVTAL